MTYEMLEYQPSTIIISSRRKEELQRVKNHCQSLNSNCNIIIKPLDVLDFVNKETDSKTEDYGTKYVQNLFSNELKNNNISDIDILVLNAGFLAKGWGTFSSVEQMKHLLNVNALGLISVAQSLIKYWFANGKIPKYAKARMRHKIVITSSMTGKMGCPGYAAYSMSKHALHGFFEAMRVEHVRNAIDFNFVCLGPLETSSATHDEHGMDQNDDIRYKREYVQKYWFILSLERAARLYVSSVLANLSESWVASQPYLFFMYGNQYMPGQTAMVTKVLGRPYLRDLPVVL